MSKLSEFRRLGWIVAVHNDYKQEGFLHTFWLFTKGNRAAKGEGRSDEEALIQVENAIHAWDRMDEELKLVCGPVENPANVADLTAVDMERQRNWDKDRYYIEFKIGGVKFHCDWAYAQEDVDRIIAYLRRFLPPTIEIEKHWMDPPER